ncbi:serine hydrolase domain-containing protein [Chitinophaga sp. 22321]|uniref:Beta-lactamase family protein n=1 Tax=Chitinophaga hostae TaxID=2831022 RepID=A0ABS5J4U8_9BACT|nr:serine hydrolase domain-containing protein [Chitinophaga hostae]MBS0030081.1 beta-lactamase family protein [Chitinophaga hostae]
MKKCGFLLMLCFHLTYHCAVAQFQDSIADKLQRYLAIKKKEIGFSGMVTICRQGKIVCAEMVGQCSADTYFNDSSLFKVASVTKSFTAMLVMLACAEERIKLSDSLAIFFPRLDNHEWRSITIDQLLSHRAGIAHNQGVAGFVPGLSMGLNPEQALAAIFNSKLLFSPGTQAAYSSPGYYLLATILEQVYHKRYADILAEKITGPLKMNHTGVYRTGMDLQNMCAGYHQVKDSMIPAPGRDFSLMKGSGDLFSSAADLVSWTNSFSGDFWSDKIRASLFAPHSDIDGHSYGYGWYIRREEANAKKAYYHGGGTFGSSSLLVIYPAYQLTIVILSNVSPLPVNVFWADVERILFDTGDAAVSPLAVRQLSPQQLAILPGAYSAGAGQPVLQIILNEGRLYAKLGTRGAFEIFAATDVEFYGRKIPVKLLFSVNGTGSITGVEAWYNGQCTRFSRQ